MNRKRAASIARIRGIQEALALSAWGQAAKEEARSLDALRRYEALASEATLNVTDTTKSGMEMRRLGDETQAWRDGIARFEQDLRDRMETTSAARALWQDRKIASEGSNRLLEKAVKSEQDAQEKEQANLMDDLINSRHTGR